MPDHVFPGPAPAILFPLRLEICHERSRRGATAQIRWIPDGCQVAPRPDGADLAHYASVGDSYPALPDLVRLYTMSATGAVQRLIDGGPIDRERVKLQLPATAEAPSGATWMWDFATAVACGMAAVVSGAQFDQLAAASWLIAVGCRADPRDDVAALLAAHHARGRLQVLHQGQCTNGLEPAPLPPGAPDPGGIIRNAALLARCLRGTQAIWRDVPGADDDEHDAPRDVHATLWDGCLPQLRHDAGYELWRRQFVDHVRGRGALPALAIGAHPYGLLVTMAGAALGRDGLLQTIAVPGDPDELRARLIGLALAHQRTIHRHVGDLSASHAHWQQAGGSPSFAAQTGRAGELLADPAEPVLARLLRVLRQHASASRCDVVTASPAPGQADQHALIVDQLGPGDYLALPDDKSGLDLTTLPVLLRLVVLSELATPEAERPAFRSRTAALYRRYCERPAELHQLMVEAIDCLSYRLDAWVTAGATQRLTELQPPDPDRPDGHGIGVYGWLEHPIGPPDPPAVPEYFQAPSPNHAHTLAILRAGAATTDAAYRIDLSAPRAAYAMSVFRDASAGVHVGQLLGAHARAQFRARTEERILLELRGLPPFDSGTGDEAHLIDGLTFATCDFAEPAANPPELKPIVEAVQARLSAVDYRTVVEVWREVRRGRDALADTAIAEAVHQFNLGNLPAVAAWFEAAQGRSIPGLPDVLRTPLRSRNVQQRALLVMRHREPAAATHARGAGASLRPITEPALAALCAQLVGVPSTVTVDVAIAGARVTRTIAVAPHTAVLAAPGLALCAVDLVIGGCTELDRRLKLWIAREIVDSPAGYGEPIASAPQGQRLVLAATAEVSRRAAASDAADWARALSEAAAVAVLVARGKPMRTGDLQLADQVAHGAQEAQQLDATAQLAAARHAVTALGALARRARPVLADLEDLQATAAAVRDPAGYLAVAGRAVMLGPLDLLDGLDPATRTSGDLEQWLAQRRDAVLALVGRHRDAVAKFARQTIAVAFADHTVVALRLDDAAPAALIEVGWRGGSLEPVQLDAGAPVPRPELVECIALAADQLVAELAAALAACGGHDRARVLAPVCGAAPQLRGGDRKALQVPGRIREPIRIASALGALGYRCAAARRISDEQLVAQLRSDARRAGRDDAARIDRDSIANLDEIAVGHTTLHVFGQDDALDALGTREPIAGLVIDEWIEPTTPETHDTAVAFHQPGPPTEAPNAILIGVPRGDAWDADELAAAVAAAIDLMRIRTLSCDELLTDDAIAASFPAVQLHDGALVRTAPLPQEPS